MDGIDNLVRRRPIVSVTAISKQSASFSVSGSVVSLDGQEIGGVCGEESWPRSTSGIEIVLSDGQQAVFLDEVFPIVVNDLAINVFGWKNLPGTAERQYIFGGKDPGTGYHSPLRAVGSSDFEPTGERRRVYLFSSKWPRADSLETFDVDGKYAYLDTWVPGNIKSNLRQNHSEWFDVYSLSVDSELTWEYAFAEQRRWWHHPGCVMGNGEFAMPWERPRGEKGWKEWPDCPACLQRARGAGWKNSYSALNRLFFDEAFLGDSFEVLSTSPFLEYQKRRLQRGLPLSYPCRTGCFGGYGERPKKTVTSGKRMRRWWCYAPKPGVWVDVIDSPDVQACYIFVNNEVAADDFLHFRITALAARKNSLAPIVHTKGWQGVLDQVLAGLGVPGAILALKT